MRQDPLKYRIRFLILTLLAIKPSHGYELSKKIEKITGGLISGSPGSIYPLLRELKEEGLVEESSVIEKGRLRKVYRLTREGARKVLEELNIFYEISNRLLALAVEARKALTRVVETGEGGCPSDEIVEALRRISKTIQEYLASLEEKYRECRVKAGETSKAGQDNTPQGESRG